MTTQVGLALPKAVRENREKQAHDVQEHVRVQRRRLDGLVLDAATGDMLADAERTLNEYALAKKQAEKALVSIERRIYAYEGSYLEETAQVGNIVKGFDALLSPNKQERRRPHGSGYLLDADRIFSASSTSFARAIDPSFGNSMSTTAHYSSQQQHHSTHHFAPQPSAPAHESSAESEAAGDDDFEDTDNDSAAPAAQRSSSQKRNKKSTKKRR